MSHLENETVVTVTAHIIDQRVGQIVFSNPPRRNALSVDLLHALDACLADLAAQRIPVVLLGGKVGQEVWSAGHDLGELAHDRDPVAYGKPLEKVLRSVRAYPGVVIAMVSGSVWGGAVDLAMSCDLVVADRSARFAMTPANIGLPYTTSGLLRFFNNLPIHLLKEMFFCAKPLDAERAAHFGVINCLVEQDLLQSTALDMALGIAAKAPLAVRAVKEQLRILEDMQPLPVQALEQIAELRRQACASEDFSEGLAAFAERRQPVFRGV
ncbi:enoyl-CoA hydratase/isomerase family protein [Collimonas arenae]|uniref:Enoyl-CoA hydratase/isomerase family protein n=1 Tax=Collimonas arenae TaxID=279058 RepID=A0A127PR12_9BURK|nr:methylmalonyl-CoA decarboxylase [Collimonas arenae]AMP00223.1 enoyl-CoA hydratase/isomerase family protein [Collimonas arenae]AMP10098.1 enoyl-CoA hydratase/isomerase family protein [Collimonas arenae]